MLRPKFIKPALVLLAALGLSACGGSGSNLAGIGGTGMVAVTSTGQITGFGSIFVNGVEYDIANSGNITVNGVPSAQEDLKIGMVVTLSGTLNSDRVTGTLSNVAYDAELKGPITTVTPGPDGQIKTLVVLGKTVIIDATNTSFEDGSSFANIAPNNIVEASGFVDSTGVLQATRIEIKDPGDTTVKVKGVITSPTSNSFVLNGFLVNFDPSLVPSNLQVVAGVEVEVEGTINNSIIDATKIEADDNGLPDNAEQMELEGLINNYDNTGFFTINGQKINFTSSTQLSPSNLILILGNDIQVEVEGPIVNGILQASEISGREGMIEIEAYVTAIPGNNILRLKITPSDTVDIIVDNNYTQLEDESGTPSPFSFGDINISNFLEIEAYQDDNGNLVATQVKRRAAGDGEISLQGPATSWTQPVGTSFNIEILGITFISNSNTIYEKDDQSISATLFVKALTSTSNPIVRVIDEITDSTTGDGFAEKMEIED